MGEPGFDKQSKVSGESVGNLPQMEEPKLNANDDVYSLAA